MKYIKTYIQENKDRFIDELIELLKIPSISADPKYKQEVLNCADSVADFLTKAGAENIEICKTKGYPIVYADKIIDEKLPTVLVYGHYDVQPADPLDLWHSGPFEPVIKKTEIHPEGAIFARGACDDKGQFFMHVKAFELMMDNNTLPCNVKFMIEGVAVGAGEDEPFVIENKDGRFKEGDVLTESYINKIKFKKNKKKAHQYIEVEVTGPNRDLHSGLYGGAVANPINILCEMISSMKDEKNHISIPGFYDNVIELSSKEREEIARAPFSLNQYKEALDLSDIHGEDGYSTMERTGIRPTLDVNGIWGGYTGEGAKTVIPSKAFAKISMRLVPNQSDAEITKLFTEYFKNIAPKSVQVKVTPHHGGEPYSLPYRYYLI